MKLGKAWLVAIATALSLGASGCIVDVVFDPIGQDASIAGSWTIDGAAPTVESCEAAGIDSVRVRFFEGSDYRDHPDLRFDCETGSFDTRPQLLIADGVWTVQLVPIDASGAVVETDPMPPRETFDTIVVGGHIDMTPVDFATPAPLTQYAGSWTINGETPDATNCGELGIDQVWVEFLDGAGAPIDGATDQFACTDGSFILGLDPGDYSVRVIAVDAANAVLAMAMREDFTLLEGETHTLNMGNPIDFVGEPFDPRGMDASIDAAWTVGKTVAEQLTCEVAGGTTVEFVFYEETDTARENGIVVAMAPCAAGRFMSMGDVLAAGTYLFSVVLVDAAEAEIGRADFDAITLDAGQTVDATATDIRLAETTLAFEIEWEYASSLGTFGNCTDAGVDSMQWDLTLDMGASPIYMSATTTDPCETLLVFNDSSGEPVTPGTYDLYVEGNDTVGKAWSLAPAATAPCQLTIAEAGDLAITASPTDCRMMYMPPP